MSRGWKDINIDGLIIQSTEAKRTEFYRETGLDRNASLEKLKKGHRDRVMQIARKLWPDQIQQEDL